MILPQPLHHVLAPKLPKVNLLATAESTSSATTYTFSGMDIGGFGGGQPFSANEMGALSGGYPLVAGSGRKVIAAIIHAEDAGATFNVTGVTIGGVAGTEYADYAGAAIAVNSAIYVWQDAQLVGIANTNVVVTHSESISFGCAVGIVEISGLRSGVNICPGSLGGGTQLAFPGMTVDGAIGGGVVLIGITNAISDIAIDINGMATPAQIIDNFSFIQLYRGTNANFTYLAGYALTPSIPLETATSARTTCMVSSSGSNAMAGIYLI